MIPADRSPPHPLHVNSPNFIASYITHLPDYTFHYHTFSHRYYVIASGTVRYNQEFRAYINAKENSFSTRNTPMTLSLEWQHRIERWQDML
jgi:hypothetical protein